MKPPFAVPRRRPGRRITWIGLLAVLALAGPAAAAPAGPVTPGLVAMKDLSLDELMNLEVSSVSRRDERWWAVPSGIDVVTGEEIRRSGVMNLPDALRLATGVHVGQSSARSWAVSLRGMNVLAANKVAVVMDGRSLFTPFFSGVNWDAQDTLLEDIDRIEVVRGPVGALWGAYAVNGLISIITKPAWETQGWLASAAGGDEDPGFFAFRYGGQAGAQTFYRVYAKYSQLGWTYDANGRQPQSATDFFQTGFRIDAVRPADTTLTLQGDYYSNQDLPLDRLQAEVSGFNVLGRWRREFSAESDLQAEAYFDHTDRLIPFNFEERRDTGSVALKFHSVHGRHDWLAGIDGLVSSDAIGNMGFAQLVPDGRTTHRAGAYAQDTFQVRPERLALTLGARMEHNSFSGWDYQPTARLAWTPSPRTTVWTAWSRAVRTPVRVDEDLVIAVPGTVIFAANDEFKNEVALAGEVGWRHQPFESLTMDVSVFAYRYDALRSTEPAGDTFLPQTFSNLLNARSRGGEVTVMVQPISRLFLKASYRLLDLEFSRDAGSVDATGGSSEGNDPRHLAMIAARLDLPNEIEVDVTLRHASALPNPALAGYTTADLRLGWRPSERWEWSLSGRNLLEPQHAEFVTTNSLNEQVHRRWVLKATWRH